MGQGTCRRILSQASIFTATVIGMIAVLAATANATSYTVTTTSDTSSSGQCTLRDAINAANGSVTSGSSCSAVNTGTDTIVFAGGVTGTIAIATNGTLPAIVSGETLTITGPTTAPGITIDGGMAVELMKVNQGATLNLQSLTLTNGSVTCSSEKCGVEGGSIDNFGILTITNGTLSSNQATCTSAGCLADGGAIFSAGPLTITNSTFSGNEANGESHGAGQGGAIYNASGQTMTITNATFSANVAAGDTALGGAINTEGGTVNLKGTILAASTPSNCSGSATTATYNIADDGTCFINTVDGNQVITPTSDIDLASTPAANGGPTFTLALTSTSSPAVNVVPPADCPATDQRGYIRPAPGQTNCDVGAFELNALPPVTVDCSKAAASTPNLTAISPFTFYPENVTGVTDSSGGGFSISITGVAQSAPIIDFPPLFCPNATVLGSTAFVRTTSPLGSSGMLYGIAFTATDKSSGTSCKGNVPVCVQGVLNHGKPCTGSATYNATSCR